MYLYPILPVSISCEIAHEAGQQTTQELIDRSAVKHLSMIYSPTGGTHAPEDHLRKIQVNVREIATRNGCPENRGRNSLRNFDSEVAKYLHQNMQITPHEAAQTGMWAFMTCVLLPDVVQWRFPGGESGTVLERFVSRERNTFGRLWWRSFILFDETEQDPYELMHQLQEDESVQLMERPNLAGNRILTLMTAKTFLAMVQGEKFFISRMDLMREVQKRVMRLSPILALEALTHTIVQEHLLDVFVVARDALIVKQVKASESKENRVIDQPL